MPTLRTLAFVPLPISMLVLAGCACGPEAKAPTAETRAFAAAVARMCDVDRQAGLAAEGDPLGVGPKRSAWINEHVDNPDAIELRTYMSVKGAAEQATMLRNKAKELGVPSCPLADTLARTGEGGLSP